MTCLEKELTEEEPQKEEGGTETQKEKKHRPRERTPKGGQRLTEGERETLRQTEIPGLGVWGQSYAGPFTPPVELFSGGKLTPTLV